MSLQNNAVNERRRIVVVDEHDRATGTTTVLAAHTAPGIRHRAFSVFLFDDEGRVLLQRRAPTKSVFGGLWANSCCSHQRPGEATEHAALRRVREELDITATDAQVLGSFEYRAICRSGHIEHEVDHVVVARARSVGSPDPAEIAETRWVELHDLASLLTTHSDRFGPWVAPASQLLFESLGRSVSDAASARPFFHPIRGDH